MLTSFRNSLGLSPSKKTAQLPLSDLTEPQTTMPHAEEPSVWGYLQVESRRGKVTGGLPILERSFTIGRASDNDVRLCEVAVSRHACRIHFEAPGKAHLQLLGSNKVTINDSHVLPLADATEPVAVSLSSEDLLIIQKYRFRFRYAEAGNSSSEPVYVPSSPSDSRTSTTKHLATPSGKHRRVRMSLVRAAAINTPRQSRRSEVQPPLQSNAAEDVEQDGELVPGLDKRQGRATETNQAAIAHQPTTPVLGTPTKQIPVDTGYSETHIGNHSILLFDSPLPLTPAQVDNVRSLMAPDSDEEGVDDEEENGDDLEQQVVVIEEGDDDDEDAADDAEVFGIEPGNPSTQLTKTHTDGKLEEQLAQGRDAEHALPVSPSKKDCRRSSFLGRAWPFSWASRGSSGERSQEHEVAQGLDDLQAQSDFPAAAVDDVEGGVDDDARESDEGIEPLSANRPRLPHSMSSPGRIGSPLFDYHGRRNVSLRTKTLLKSSAALAEKLEQECIENPEASQEAEASPVTPPEVDFVTRSAAMTEATKAEDGPSREEDTRERDARAHVEESDEEDEVDQSLSVVGPLPQLKPFRTAIPAAEPIARSKRLSMPAETRRRSFFGLLPVVPSAREAEDVVSTKATAEQVRKEATTDEVGQKAAPAPPATVHESLKQPARETVRYLLGKSARGTVSEPSSVESTPATPIATSLAPQPPRYGMLRELMLGRPENALLLDQTRKTKRGSLILGSQGSNAETTPLLAPPIALTPAQPPDLKFLLSIFALPPEEFEYDPQLQSLRNLFAEHEASLTRGHLTADEQRAISIMLATPAAHRALLGAAAVIARPSADEAAVQEAALMTSPNPDAQQSDERGFAAMDSMLSPGDDSPASPRRKKTRRGCRGGRRRGSKSFNPSAQLTELAQLYLQQSSDNALVPSRVEASIAETTADEAAGEENNPPPVLDEVSEPVAPATPEFGSTPKCSSASHHQKQSWAVQGGSGPKETHQMHPSSLQSRIGRRVSRAEAQVLNDGQDERHAAPSAVDVSCNNTSEVTQSPAEVTETRSQETESDKVERPAKQDIKEGRHSRQASRVAVRAPRAPASPSKTTASKRSESADNATKQAPTRSARPTRSTGGASKDQRRELSVDPSESQPQVPSSPVRRPPSTRAKAASSPIKATPPLAASTASAPSTRRSTRTARPARGGRGRGDSDNEGQEEPRSEPSPPVTRARARNNGRALRQPSKA